MASLAVSNAVIARINSEWNGGAPRCPLSLPNQAFELPPDSGPFLAVQFPVSNEDILELGTKPQLHREEGVVRLVLVTGVNQGTDVALTWLDELRAIFRQQQFDGVITYAPSPPIEADDNDTGNYYRLSVAIPYQYDLVA
ncbi:MAG: hypothetical protein E6J90_08850 [Deltaproteobacteria bacterium]|nr:MAG: hypothetical protein E6J90_08850 [Deltaproteobacteria bacterium]